MITLFAGIALALGALAYLLYPIFRESSASQVPRNAGNRSVSIPDDSADAAASKSAIEALKEIEFDRATGKLSDADYTVLREKYTAEAVAAMRAEGSAPSGEGAEDAVEALVSRFRTRNLPCPTCGPRPEADAVFCSSCGRYLGGNCVKCGAAVAEQGARFCSSCGSSLAA